MEDLTHEPLLRAIVSQHTKAGLVNGWAVAEASYRLAFQDKSDLEAEVRHLRYLVGCLTGLTGKTIKDDPAIGHGVIVTSGGKLDVEKLLDRIDRIEQRVSRSIDDGR